MTGLNKFAVGWIFLAVLGSCAPAMDSGEAEDPEVATDVGEGVPVFEVDRAWPTLPDDWTWGQVLGVNVDGRDHVWVTTGGRVAEFDPEGNPVQVWSARDEEGERTVIHGLFVDHNDYVWTNAREQHQILKFTRDGQLVLTIGTLNETGGSDDPNLLGRPAELYVVPETNELFVVDGYSNRRVIVFDADTGEYVMERIIRLGTGSAFSVALSHDPEQRFVYVADGTQHRIWILRRSDLEVVGQFSGEGSEPGQLGRPHNLTTDSQGNIYVAEAEPGRRAQKFAFKELIAQ